MRAFSQLVVLAFLVAAAVGANADPRYSPSPALPNKAGVPSNAPPAMPPHPPSWYYNPYTQGVVALPQRGGD
jgi:hypothetical protein